MSSCLVQTGNSTGVNVRSAKAVSSSNLLGVIDNDEYVNVVRCDDTWATLMYNGTPAFLQHQYLVNPPSTIGEVLLDTSSNNKAVCNASSVTVAGRVDNICAVVGAVLAPASGMRAGVEGEVTVDQHVVAVDHRAFFQLGTVNPYSAGTTHGNEVNRTGGGTCSKRCGNLSPLITWGNLSTVEPLSTKCSRCVGVYTAGAANIGRQCVRFTYFKVIEVHVDAHVAISIGFIDLHRLSTHILLIACISVGTSTSIGNNAPAFTAFKIVVGKQIHHSALHLGDGFRVVDGIGIRILREAGIAQLVVDRNAVAVIVEVVEQLLAAQVVGDHGQTILVLIGAVVGAQITTGDTHALHPVGFPGSVVLVGHLHTIAVGRRGQQTVGIVGVVHVFGARLTGQFPHMGQATAFVIRKAACVGFAKAGRIDGIDAVAGIEEAGIAPNTIFHVLDDVAGSSNRHGVAAGVGQGLEHLHIGVVVTEFRRGQIEDPAVVTLVRDGGRAAGDGQRHALAGLIRPRAVGVLEVMAGAIFIHVHIIGGIAIGIRQRFLVQGLLDIHLPAGTRAKGGHVAVAGIVDMADGHRYAAAAAGGILPFKDQVAVVQAHMTHTGTPHILILVNQIILQTSQRHVVDGDVACL